MKLINLFLTAALLMLCCSRAAAQDMHPHTHDRSEKLGQVNFTVSCSAPSQKQFNRATALLHSFWYEQAENAFTAISRRKSVMTPTS